MVLCLALVHVQAANNTDIFDLSLDELLQVEITIASHVSTTWKDTPAAVFVLTSEDIKRSGMRQIPELLRLIPGMHVAKMSNSLWSINARNENGLFSGTMLIMIDGRSVYNPLTAGTYWDDVDVYIDDIDHIEVVRGPGGSVWGSNAVTGVVNIITKSSFDTHGQHAYAAVGDNNLDYETGWRVGGGNDNYSWRVYVKHIQRSRGVFASPDKSRNPAAAFTDKEAKDDGEASQAGFRIDTEGGSVGSISIQGTAYDGNSNGLAGETELSESVTKKDGYSLLASWDKVLSDKWNIDSQFYIDEFNRDIASSQNIRVKTHDIGFKLIRMDTVHSFAFGAGFRNQYSELTFSPGRFNLLESSLWETKSKLFLQDTLKITETLSMIFGGKLETHSELDNEWQPSFRILWSPKDNHTFWSAISKSSQYASRNDRSGYVDFSFLPGPACTPPFTIDPDLGCILKVYNDDADNLKMVSYEAGHRFSYGSTLTTDLALFLEEFEDAEQLGSSTPMNKVYGFEATLGYHFAEQWRLITDLTWHKGEIINQGVIEISQQLPRHLANVQIQYTPFDGFNADLNTYYVDHVSINDFEIPSYVRVDLSFNWQLKDKLGVALLLTNLADSEHVETVREDGVVINTAIESGAFIKVEMEF